jgi:hypothetical protein
VAGVGLVLHRGARPPTPEGKRHLEVWDFLGPFSLL